MHSALEKSLLGLAFYTVVNCKEGWAMGATPAQVRDELRSQVEENRWHVLMKLQAVAFEFRQLHEALRVTEAQQGRLFDDAPDPAMCPKCHYLDGVTVRMFAKAVRRPRLVQILTCPKCGTEIEARS